MDSREYRPALITPQGPSSLFAVAGVTCDYDVVAVDDDVNLYAYVGNDPLNKADPTGMYECNGSKQQCGAVNAALGRAKEAAANMKEGSTEQKNLNAVLNFIGAAGEKNGVNIGFSSSVRLGNAEVEADGSTVNITLSKSFDTVGRGYPGDATSNRAGTLIHEGQHGRDERAMGRNPVHVKEELPMERRAYEVQSQMHKALGHEP